MATDWRCARCGTAEGRNRRSFCCRDCGAWLEAQGLMWCGICQQPRPRLHGKLRGRCRRCRTMMDNARDAGRIAPRPTPAARPVATVRMAATDPIARQIGRAYLLLAAPDWPGSLDDIPAAPGAPR